MRKQLTVLLQMSLDDLHRKPLVHSSVARVALVAASMSFPLVLVWLPGELALADEPFLVLFGVVPCSSDWLLVEVVLWVFVNLLQSCGCLFVDLQVILVQSFLPIFGLSIIDRGGAFIGCQGCVSLASPQMRFTSWCIRGPLVFVDVKRRDAAKQALIETFGQVFKAPPFPWVGPCLPNRAQLHNHIDGCENMLGQGDEPLKEGASFGLWTWCHARYGALSHQSAQREGVDT